MTLLGWAAPAGLATGLAAWMLAGGASAGLDKLDGVETRLMALKPPAARRAANEIGTADLLATPLFALTTGPGAIREPSIRLDGVSVSRRRLAALVSIDGKPALWLTAGQSSDGVTLEGVSSSAATFETAVGTKTLNLGEQSAASTPDPHAAPAPAATPGPSGPDQMPPGRHGPPEPASAPRPR
ncbi:hypothetical protein [Phenylobacterium sp.]|uniref:hypothetical protein n=1 Tax=Phenylobacterium sp. TaxID=1871053 RepID=UPI002E2FCEB7|nr:hypothetical protein [Phenylobacterium sp.]HEX3365607.1 hypothetical protein [Phenylobacterium sp.]